MFIVAGDYCLDKYIYLDTRLDRKFDYSDLNTYCVVDEKLYPGGAGNVAKNLLAMGAEVTCIGLLGNDGNGFDLRKTLEKHGANVDNLHVNNQRVTNTYYRPVRRSEKKDEHMNELLFINNELTNIMQETDIINSFEQNINDADGIIIVEQFENEIYGSITPNVKNYINSIASKYTDKFFVVDSRNNIDKYRNVFIKCNQFEFIENLRNAHNIEIDYVNTSSFNLIKSYINLNTNKGIYVTLGDRGMIYGNEEITTTADAICVTGEIDTCGAGDSASVGIITALCTGFSETDAMVIGNICAYVTVKQIGVTGIITYEKLMQAYKEIEDRVLIR
jgi:bifunctional ADP-heptose synthase (sugar kinase/adenylyltransferase)